MNNKLDLVIMISSTIMVGIIMSILTFIKNIFNFNIFNHMTKKD